MGESCEEIFFCVNAVPAPFSVRLDSGTAAAVVCTVPVVELVSPDFFSRHQPAVCFCVRSPTMIPADLHIAEPGQPACGESFASDAPCHGPFSAVFVLQGFVQIQEPAALGQTGDPLLYGPADGIAHAAVRRQLPGIQFRITAAQDEAVCFGKLPV